MDETLKRVSQRFDRHIGEIESPTHTRKSNEVLSIISPDPKGIGFQVEESKASEDIIKVPVLFSQNNRIDKFFEADAVSKDYNGHPFFDTIFNFFETLFTNGRLQLPLKGIVLIGY